MATCRSYSFSRSLSVFLQFLSERIQKQKCFKSAHFHQSFSASFWPRPVMKIYFTISYFSIFTYINYFLFIFIFQESCLTVPRIFIIMSERKTLDISVAFVGNNLEPKEMLGTMLNPSIFLMPFNMPVITAPKFLTPKILEMFTWPEIIKSKGILKSRIKFENNVAFIFPSVVWHGFIFRTG